MSNAPRLPMLKFIVQPSPADVIWLGIQKGKHLVFDPACNISCPGAAACLNI